MQKERNTYPAHHPATPPTLLHQVSRAFADFPADEVAGFAEDMPFLPRGLHGLEVLADGFMFAAEGLLDEPVAVLEQVGADLSAGAGEGVEGVEVDALGDLDDDAVEAIVQKT